MSDASSTNPRGRRPPGARERAADIVQHLAARTGVTPRAVLGLLVVLTLVLAVLGVRAAMATARSVPEPVGPAAPLAAPAVGASPAGGGAASPAPLPTPAAAPASSGPTTVAVHVVGQVRHPGVVLLPVGARVQAALTAAGGALGSADLARVNLARLVVDGEQVVVPRPGEPGTAAQPGPARGTTGAPSNGAGPPIDLNAAGLAELDSLPGVGPVLAQRILDWRTQHGRFTSVEELGEVSGIGDAVLASVRPRVHV